jgi:hypothetical protein
VINTVYRQAPREYLKFVGSIISKELLVSDSATPICRLSRSIPCSRS